MAKKRVNISIDEDVLRFIDELAFLEREERSRFINKHFAQMMPPGDRPGTKQPVVKPPRKGKSGT